MPSRVKIKQIPGEALKSTYANNVKVPGRQIVSRIIQEGKGLAYGLNGQVPPEPVGISALGTPVFDNVIFPAGSYTDLNGNLVDYEEIRIDTVLVTIDQDKNIIRTPVLGRNGTVKRFVSDGDFAIAISGKIVNNDQFLQAPNEDLGNFIKILEAPESIPIVSGHLQRFDIFDIVIKGYNLPQGSKQNEQEFQIRAYSDEPFDFIVTSDNG